MTPISSINWNTYWNYAKRAGRIYPNLVFGTGGEPMSMTLKDSFFGIKGADGKRTGGKYFNNFGRQLKDAFKAGESHNEAMIKKSGGFWKSQWEAIKTTPKVIQEAITDGGSAAKAAGKSKFWGQTKGLFKGLGKRMPLIGSALILLTELPNIFKATANEGIVSGAAEVVKAGARLGGGMLLGTIGAAFGGPIGSIVGYMIGDWITSKIVGKSYSEKKAEEKAALDAQKKNITDSPINIPGYQPIPNTNTASTANMFDPSKVGTSMTPQQLAQLEMALASGTGLPGASFDRTV